MPGAEKFARLGLAPSASVDDAKAAFRRLALVHHPDKGGDAEQFREISDAFAAIATAAGRADEAEALLADPLADLLGPGWARGFADGSVDPMQAMQAARERAAAELGGHDPLAESAAALGLGNMSTEELQKLVGAMDLGGGDDADGAQTGPAAGSNMFKDFFDSMPEEERGPMMALFEKTFPAFLASEFEEQSHEAENALFAAALAQGALPERDRGSGDGAAETPGALAVREERQRLAEEHNSLAIEAFGLERYAMAAEALGHALALDPCNPAFYGNRSLALERAGRHEEALADAESCLRCDPRYVAGYERKGRALLGLDQPAAALAAFRRGLVLEADHEGLREGADEADAAAMRQRMHIMEAGSDAIGGWPVGAASSAKRPQRLQ